MHSSLTLILLFATASTPLEHTVFGGPRPGAPHPPGPPPPGPGGRPNGGWIFDTFPLLMNWTLFYYFCGITVAMLLANILLSRWEDKVDQQDKQLAHDAQQAEEAGHILAFGDQTEAESYGAMVEDAAPPPRI